MTTANGNGARDPHPPDAIVVGAGLAGLVCTLELLRSGHTVLLLDRCHPHEVGGLAREAFGGMFMVDSPEQRRSRIRDNERLALEDWLRIAELGPEERWPRAWAEQYVTRARDDVGGWLRELGVRFFPVVNWAERGNFGDGNSVPRFHLTWGTGKALVQAVWGAIEGHPRRANLEVRFGARVTGLLTDGQSGVVGCRVEDEDLERGRRAGGGEPRAFGTWPPTEAREKEGDDEAPEKHTRYAQARRWWSPPAGSAATTTSCAACGRPRSWAAPRSGCWRARTPTPTGPCTRRWGAWAAR